MPFDRTSLPRELRPFVDDDGRLVQWPVKQRTKKQAIALVASRFECCREYTEREIKSKNLPSCRHDPTRVRAPRST